MWNSGRLFMVAVPPVAAVYNAAHRPVTMSDLADTGWDTGWDKAPGSGVTAGSFATGDTEWN